MHAFMKAKYALLSSAAVEQLFSTAGQILSARQCKLSDEQFDIFVFSRHCLKKVEQCVKVDMTCSCGQ